jgi:hypothetical protein
VRYISAPHLKLLQLLQRRQLHQLPFSQALIARQAQVRQLAEVRNGSSACTVAKAALPQLKVAQLLQAAGYSHRAVVTKPFKSSHYAEVRQAR